MPKVSASLELALRMASNQYNTFRPGLTISDIDTGGNVEAQIEASIPAVQKVWDEVESQMARIVEMAEIADTEIVAVELRKNFIEMRKEIADIKKWMIKQA
jgi:hypothetical protein